MASHKQYLDYILDQVADLSDLTYRAMMGEFILYCHGKIIGGIYDDRLLVKPVQAALDLMPNATFELPYTGAKAMLLVEEVDDRAFLVTLFEALADALPEVNQKRK